MKSAFYEKDITPPLGCSMPGYFNLRLGSDVKDRLYVKAVVVTDDINTIAIVAVDACGLRTETCEKITKRIEEYTDLKSENIMVCSTHTHTGGPALGDNVPNDKLYYEMLCNQAADSVILAYKRLKDTNIKYVKGKVDSISFNRNFIMKDGTIRTNPGRLNPDIIKPFAGIDPDLSILYFKDEENKPCGAIVNFACHQDCVDGTEYSGDFSSIISKELKKVYGNDFVSIFIAGACGNINHFDVSKESDAPDHYVKMGKILATEAKSVIKDAKDVKVNRVSSIKQNIKIKKRIPSEEEIANAKDAIKNIKMLEGVKLASDSAPDQFRLAMANRLMLYLNDENKECDICLQVLRIGDCIFYGIPCEYFVQFGQYIKENSQSDRNIIATICNGYHGYVPVKEMFSTDIYEAKLGSSSYLVPEAGYIMADKVLEMAKKL